MAYYVDFMCMECGQFKRGLKGDRSPYPIICSECEKHTNELKFKKYLEKLQSLSIEERLLIIEKYIYSQNKEK